MSECLRIGIAGPVDLFGLADLLDYGTPTTAGYAAPVVSTLARGFVERGHNVDIFTLSPSEKDVGAYRGKGIRLNVGLMRSSGRARDAFRIERARLLELLDRSDVDILHAHWTYEFALAALATSKPTVVTVHDWWPAILRHHPHPYRVVRAAMQHRVLRRAPNLIANSAYTAEHLRRWYRLDVPIIPNAIAIGTSLPERTPLDRRSPVIGSVNNGFGKLKNVRALIRAFEIVLRQRPGARLRLVGTGFESGGVAEEFARRTTGTEQIEFVGPVPFDQVLEEMRHFDVLMHPSLEESFGSSVIEAIAEGALVIAGQSSGAIPWVLGNGRIGELVDVRDPRAIADGIDRLLGLDDGAWRDRQLAGFTEVQSRFSLDAVVDQHEAIYRRVVARHRGW